MLGWLPNPLIVPVGFVIGILIAAPVGPVNVLCIQRSLERGTFAGLVAGVGAVLADGLIALIAALGVGVVAGVVEHHRFTIQAVGGLALLAFGVRLIYAVPELALDQIIAQSPRRFGSLFRELIWDLPTAFFLTITNPGAVLGLFAIFSGVGTFVALRGPVEALIMVAAIMAGSMAWWITLSLMIGAVRNRIDAQLLGRINMAAGALLVAFSVVLFGELIWGQLASR